MVEAKPKSYKERQREARAAARAKRAQRLESLRADTVSIECDLIDPGPVDRLIKAPNVSLEGTGRRRRSVSVNLGGGFETRVAHGNARRVAEGRQGVGRVRAHGRRQNPSDDKLLGRREVILPNQVLEVAVVGKQVGLVRVDKPVAYLDIDDTRLVKADYGPATN